MGVARRMLAQHALPFISGWDIKGPLFHFICAGVLYFGDGFRSLRILDTALLCLFCLGLYSLVYQLTGGQKISAAISVILWLIFAPLTFAWTVQPDLWGAYLALALFFLPLTALSPGWRYGLSGFILGALVLIKLPMLLFGILPLVALYNESTRGKLFLFRYAGLLMGGFLVPVVAMLALYASKGEAQTLIDMYLNFTLEIHRFPVDRRHHGEWSELLSAAMLQETRPAFPSSWIARWALFVAVLIGYFKLREKQPGTAHFLLSGWLAGFLSVLMQHRYYDSHFFPYLLPTCILAACAISDLRTYQSRMIWGMLLLQIGWWWQGAGHFYPAGWFRLAGAVTAEDYRDIHAYDIFRSDWVAAAVERVEHLSTQQDAVVVWGFYQIVPELAGRSSPTRFGFNYPMVIDSRWREGWRREYIQALSARPPRLFLVQKNDRYLLLPMSSDEALKVFPELMLFLSNHYALLYSDALFDYYRRQ